MWPEYFFIEDEATSKCLFLNPATANSMLTDESQTSFFFVTKHYGRFLFINQTNSSFTNAFADNSLRTCAIYTYSRASPTMKV